MKVIHLIKTGHGSTWAQRQLAALRDHDLELEVLLAEDGPMRARYEDLGIRTAVIPSDFGRFRSPIEFARAARAYRAFVRERKPDILHAHSVGGAMFARTAGRYLHVPRIFQVPGPLHLEHALPALAETITADRDDWWLATCEATRQHYLGRGVAADRVGLNYYGIELDKVVSGNGTGVRNELGIGRGTALIAMVALFYAPKKWLGQRRGLKGHEDLVDAAALLLAEGRDVRVAFVGSAWGDAAWYEAQVQAYARERLGDHVHFLGFRRDVPDIYAGADVAVHASHSENLGGTAESIMGGAPTVASRVGGHPDVVADGETGYLFEARDPGKLADALRRALDDRDRSRAMVAEGQRRITERFNVERTAAELFDFYKAVRAA